MTALWTKIQLWAASKGGWTHLIAAVYVAATGAFAFVPQFHALVTKYWGITPPDLRDLIACGLALYAWYRKSAKPLPADIAPVAQQKAVPHA